MLIDRYEIKDIAIKVVGVGSVGTLCAVMLMMASERDPLFLQVKEERPSVLEAYAGKSIYPNHGQRIVNGYRLMQSASDIFLGWAKGNLGRHVYRYGNPRAVEHHNAHERLERGSGGREE